MKTSIFDFRRMGLLFQRYFIERYRSELIYWGIMAIVFVFLRNNVQSVSGLITIAGAFFAARFFHEIHHPTNSVAYFMIPATQLEKLTVAIVMTTLYYFVMMMLAYVIGNLTGTLLNNILASFDFLPVYHSTLQWEFFEKVNPDFFSIANNAESISYSAPFFVGYLIFQSLFLFGGIYFKKNQTFKTFASFMLFMVVLALFIGLEAKFIVGDFFAAFTSPKEDLEYFVKMVEYTVKIIFYLLPPFFWLVSYFRLTEKQV